MPIVLGLIHGFDYVLSNWLIGSTVFYSLISTAGGAEAQSLLSDWPKKMRLLLGLTVFSSLSWMLFTANDMAESWSPGELWTAMAHTSFGHLWCLKLVALFFLLFTVRAASKNRTLSFAFLGIVLLLPLVSILTGHSGAQKDALLFRVALDWSHSLAVGIWSGGLWMLYLWLGKRLTLKQIAPDVSVRVVKRFSHFAMASTGVITLSGLTMAYLAGVSLLQPWTSQYGLFIIGKVVFFGAALLAAAINQFVHLKNWNPANELKFAQGVQREVRLELILVLLIFSLAGFLARTPLPNG